MLSNMIYGCLSQNNSPLSIALNKWIENPKTKISIELDKLQNKEVKSENESKLICEALEIVKTQLQHSFDEKIEDNIYNLSVLFQKVTSKEAALYLNDYGILLLIDILEIIKSKNYKLKKDSSCETMILKMFAFYKNPKGINKLSELVNNDFKNDSYFWNIILNIVSEDDKKYNLIINGLNSKIPTNFLGISYLDMCNSIAIRKSTFKHPFNSDNGFTFLKNILKTSEKEEESYVLSVTTSIPYLAKDYQDMLLQIVRNYKDPNIQIEVAWVEVKIGNENSIDKLVNFAKDYRYSTKAVSYLKELHLESKIPTEINNPDFKALSEMCNWLAHPNEFDAFPDQAFILDKRNLYWPPTNDIRTIYLIKYRYVNYNLDGTDEVGIGLVGSITFSLIGLENILKLKPIELLALHCNWELHKDNFQDIKSGLELLRKYNKDLE